MKTKKILLSIGAVLPSVVGMTTISANTKQTNINKELENKIRKYITVTKNRNSDIILGGGIVRKKDFIIDYTNSFKRRVEGLVSALSIHTISFSRVNYQGNIKVLLKISYKENKQSALRSFRMSIWVRGYGKHKITAEDKRQAINNISITKKDNDLTKWAQDKDDFIIKYSNIAVKIGKKARQLNVRSAWPIGIIEKDGKKQVKLRIAYREANFSTNSKYKYKYFDAVFGFSKAN